MNLNFNKKIPQYQRIVVLKPDIWKDVTQIQCFKLKFCVRKFRASRSLTLLTLNFLFKFFALIQDKEFKICLCLGILYLKVRMYETHENYKKPLIPYRQKTKQNQEIEK